MLRHQQPKMITFSHLSSHRLQLPLVIFIIFILSTNHLVSSLLNRECNFELYETGCYSQANIVCDIHSNTCKCHPESPVLIEDRLCVKRLKLHEICEYNEQCDTQNGIYCLYQDLSFVNKTATSQHQNDHTRIMTKLPAPEPLNNINNHLPRNQEITNPIKVDPIIESYVNLDHLNPRCRYLNLRDEIEYYSHLSKSTKLSHKNNIGPRLDYDNNNNYSPKHHNSDTTNTNNLNPTSSKKGDTRLFWLFLLGAPTILSIILLYLRSQYHVLPIGFVNTSHHQRNANMSDSNRVLNQPPSNYHQSDNENPDCDDIDVPPPYEVAIRMKL